MGDRTPQRTRGFLQFQGELAEKCELKRGWLPAQQASPQSTASLQPRTLNSIAQRHTWQVVTLLHSQHGRTEPASARDEKSVFNATQLNQGIGCPFSSQTEMPSQGSNLGFKGGGGKKQHTLNLLKTGGLGRNCTKVACRLGTSNGLMKTNGRCKLYRLLPTPAEGDKFPSWLCFSSNKAKYCVPGQGKFFQGSEESFLVGMEWAGEALLMLTRH